MISAKQQGVALFIVLVLLVVLTTLSLSAMRSAIMETKISANYQHKHLSFQAAENMQEVLIALPVQEINFPVAVSAVQTDVITIESTDQDVGSDLKIQGNLQLTNLGKRKNVKVGGNSIENEGLVYIADSFGQVMNTQAKTHTRVEVFRPTSFK